MGWFAAKWVEAGVRYPDKYVYAHRIRQFHNRTS